jgi:hypothetical protein
LLPQILSHRNDGFFAYNKILRQQWTPESESWAKAKAHRRVDIIPAGNALIHNAINLRKQGVLNAINQKAGSFSTGDAHVVDRL